MQHQVLRCLQRHQIVKQQTFGTSERAGCPQRATHHAATESELTVLRPSWVFGGTTQPVWQYVRHVCIISAPFLLSNLYNLPSSTIVYHSVPMGVPALH